MAFSKPALWGASCCLLLVSGCAGYQIGHRSLYRTDIRTVYVPMFRSESFRRDLGERLTEAVVKEIELNTPYKVVQSADADSILSGVVLRDTKVVLGEDPNDNPRNIETDLLVEVNWYDRRGQFLMQGACFSLGPPGLTITENSYFIPEGGQSVATAHANAIQQLAEQIVNQMERPW